MCQAYYTGRNCTVGFDEALDQVFSSVAGVYAILSALPFFLSVFQLFMLFRHKRFRCRWQQWDTQNMLIMTCAGSSVICGLRALDFFGFRNVLHPLIYSVLDDGVTCSVFLLMFIIATSWSRAVSKQFMHNQRRGPAFYVILIGSILLYIAVGMAAASVSESWLIRGLQLTFAGDFHLVILIFISRYFQALHDFLNRMLEKAQTVDRVIDPSTPTNKQANRPDDSAVLHHVSSLDSASTPLLSDPANQGESSHAFGHNKRISISHQLSDTIHEVEEEDSSSAANEDVSAMRSVSDGAVPPPPKKMRPPPASKSCAVLVVKKHQPSLSDCRQRDIDTRRTQLRKVVGFMTCLSIYVFWMAAVLFFRAAMHFIYRPTPDDIGEPPSNARFIFASTQYFAELLFVFAVLLFFGRHSNARHQLRKEADFNLRNSQGNISNESTWGFRSISESHRPYVPKNAHNKRSSLGSQTRPAPDSNSEVSDSAETGSTFDVTDSAAHHGPVVVDVAISESASSADTALSRSVASVPTTHVSSAATE